MSDSEEPIIQKDWPRVPIHRLGLNGVYMMTSATLNKHCLFDSPQKLTLLESELLSLAKQFGWHLEAWAVFSNHYHFIAQSDAASADLREMTHKLHSNTGRELNKIDGSTGRTVWYNFWDTKLTYQKSYLARLNYVHQNPVKHGLVPVANQYQWCSASWFERTASPADVKTIYGFKIDQLNIKDDF